MEKIMGNPMYAWSRGVGAAVAAFIGLYAALKDKKVLGFTPVGWLLLAILSAMGVVLNLLTRILAALESAERS
jgi:hypothetical protein